MIALCLTEILQRAPTVFVPSTLSKMRTVEHKHCGALVDMWTLVTGGNSTLCIGSAVIWANG
jgi:hypothetical protein